jgi:hypothetical protein
MLRQTMGTNNGKVADDISNSYKYGEGESCKFYLLNGDKSSSCSHMFYIAVCLEFFLRTECHSALFTFELVCR